jgi:hypothetical protein
MPITPLAGLVGSRRGFWVLLVLPFTVACGDLADPNDVDSSPSNSVSLSGPRVVRFPPRYPVEQRVLAKGYRDAAGECSLDLSVRLAQGQALFRSVAEYNPDTCEYVIAHHPPSSAPPGFPRPPAPPRDQEQSGPSNRESAASNFMPPGQLSAEFWHPDAGGTQASQANSNAQQQQCPEQFGLSAGAQQRLWYEDPIGLDVSEHQLDTWYFYSPDNCIQYLNAVSRTDQLTSTGWVLLEHDLDLYPQLSYTRLDAQAVSAMGNFDFCDPHPTYTTYNNLIRHFDDGYMSFWPGGVKQGECAGFLSFHVFQDTF